MLVRMSMTRAVKFVAPFPQPANFGIASIVNRHKLHLVLLAVNCHTMPSKWHRQALVVNISLKNRAAGVVELVDTGDLKSFFALSLRF